MPAVQLAAIISAGILGLIAQADIMSSVEQFGAFAIAFSLAVWVIIQTRKDRDEERRERQALDELIFTQVIPLVTKSTEVLQESTRLNVEVQRAADRLLERLSHLEARIRDGN